MIDCFLLMRLSLAFVVLAVNTTVGPCEGASTCHLLLLMTVLLLSLLLCTFVHKQAVHKRESQGELPGDKSNKGELPRVKSRRSVTVTSPAYPFRILVSKEGTCKDGI
jgi:hypothetical protein